MTRKTLTLFTALVLALTTSFAAAPASAQDDFTDKNVTLGPKLGVYLPNLVNDLGPHVNVDLEFAWMLPFLDKRLALAAEIGWAPPTADGKEMDARLGEDGSEWSHDTETDQLYFSIGPLFRFLKPGELIVPYVGVMFRTYFLRTEVDGAVGDNKFGKNTEESTEYGVVGIVGGEVKAGPGAVLLEADFGWSDFPHTITGDTSTGALSIKVGYRLFL